MTYKITTDFAGTESLATTKTRLESILDFWLGSGSTSSVSTWGDIRTLLNTVAPAAITIADGELASSFRTKLNTLNSTDGVVSSLLFNSDEPGVWYDPSDLTTLFQDTTGTTPVTTPGQTVGLMLDKSKGLVLGSELVTNGGFVADTTGWTAASSAVLSVNSGSMVVTNGATAFGYAYQAISTVVGKDYTVLFSVTGGTSTGSLFIGTTIGGFENYNSPSRGVGNYTARFIATATTTYVRLGLTQNTSGATVQFDNISVKELPGFHATQPTAAARPTYGIVPETGRRNLLTFTEQFDNAAWVKARCSVEVDSTTSPFGDLSAEKLVEDTTATNSHNINVSPSFTSGTSYTLSVYAKESERPYILLLLPGTAFGSTTFATFNLSTGAIVTSGNSPTTDAVDLGNGWWRVSISKTATATSAGIVEYRIATEAATTGIYTGDGTSGIFIWGAQLEVGSTATDYQRVGSQFDVTEAGVPSLGYLSFDGVDDFMVTPTITPGTDKAQVFAGVRKLSDERTGMLLETGTTGGQSGSLTFVLPGSSNQAALGSRGTITATASIATGFAAPASRVLTATADIGGDTVVIRSNGVQAAQSLADQGAGNYLAYSMFIGARAGTSLFFSGHVHQIITRFGPNLSSDVIGRAETYTAQKTGVTL